MQPFALPRAARLQMNIIERAISSDESSIYTIMIYLAAIAVAASQQPGYQGLDAIHRSKVGLTKHMHGIAWKKKEKAREEKEEKRQRRVPAFTIQERLVDLVFCVQCLCLGGGW